MSENKKYLWCYSKANTMEGNTFSDDVAICEAEDLAEAISIFKKMYDFTLLRNNVRRVEFNEYGIFVATDY